MVSAPPAEAQHDGAFRDDDGHIHEFAIQVMARQGILKGCNPPANDRVCPDRALSRAEMATIFTRVMGLRPAAHQPFEDIADSPHRDDISAVRSAGLVMGCNPPRNDRFCPERPISRGEVATLLARALHLPDRLGGPFTDIGSSVHAPHINAVESAGIVKGCNPPSNSEFCPNRSLTRGEAATIVVRGFGLENTSPGRPSTTTTTLRPSPPTLPPEAGQGYAGRPPAGSIYWGAAIGGNGDPRYHEAPTGVSLSVRRTYFWWTQRTGSMISSVKADIANDRLPWVSVMPPGCDKGQVCWSWQSIADGSYDAEIDSMLGALNAVDGPVWLSIHHEPESEVVDVPNPGAEAFVAMNRRVRSRMSALGVDNVALAPILMGWTWSPRSGRDVDQWWAPGIFDFVGMDPYNDPHPGLGLVEIDWWPIGRRWAESKGVDLAVAEWGMRCADEPACAGTNGGEKVREWYEEAAGSAWDGEGARVTALSAFDSDRHSPEGSWELTGTQLSEFRFLLRDPRTHRISQGW